MKNNASLSHLVLASAIFGTLFTSCTKEDGILPTNQISALTSDTREARTKGEVSETKQGNQLTYNNEVSRLGGEAQSGDRWIVKCTKEKCAVVKAYEGDKTASLDQGFTPRRRNIEEDKVWK